MLVDLEEVVSGNYRDKEQDKQQKFDMLCFSVKISVLEINTPHLNSLGHRKVMNPTKKTNEHYIPKVMKTLESPTEVSILM